MVNINSKTNNKGYISSHFGNIHDIEHIEKHYNNYFYFFSNNYKKYLPENKNARIIDMGCGLGETLHCLKKLGYNNFLGIDYSEECVAFCKSKGVACEKGDVKNYFMNLENSIDIIIFNDIIEHFKKEEMVDILQGMFKALRHGGRLIVKTMNGGNAILSTTTLYSDLTHEMMYDEFSLHTMLKFGGFRRVVLRPSNLFVYYKNPFNYIAWLVNSVFCIMLRLYFILNNKKNKIFTKNLLAIGIKK